MRDRALSALLGAGRLKPLTLNAQTYLRSALLALLALTPIVQSQDASAPPGAAEVRFYDLGFLRSSAVDQPEDVNMSLHLHSSFLDGLEPERYGVGVRSRPAMSADDLTKILEGVLGGAAGQDSIRLAREGYRLRAEGDGVSLDTLEQLLDQFAGTQLMGLRLELYALAPNATTQDAATSDAPSQLTASQAEEWIASGRAELVVLERGCLGKRLLLGRESFRASLYDYDVEVATDAQTTDPAVTVLREGYHVGALVERSAGGGLLLRTWGRRGSVLDSREVALPSYGGGTLELVSQQTGLIVSSGLIEDGGALLVGGQGAGSGMWLVRVRMDEPLKTIAGSSPGVLIPMGELTTGEVLFDVPQLPFAEPSGGWSRRDGTLASWLGDYGSSRLYPSALVDQLLATNERRELGGAVQVLSNQLWVSGSVELVAEALDLVERLRAGSTRSAFEVSLRYDLVPSEQLPALLAQDDAEALAAGLSHRLQVNGILADSAMVVDGVEHFYLKDMDVETAEGAAAGDPIVGNRVEGVALWAHCSRDPRGQLCTWIDFQYQEDGPMRTAAIPTWIPLAAESAGGEPTPHGFYDLGTSLELPSTRRAGFRSMLQFPSGAWQLLGVQRLPGSDRALVAALRVTSVAR